MAILITGAAGFVGLNLVQLLLAKGQVVVALDSQPLPEAALSAFARLPGTLHSRIGDVCTDDDLDLAFAAAPIEAVLHAAVITAGEARERDTAHLITRVNVLGAVACLDFAHRRKVKRFLYLSSGAVYGYPADGGGAQITEERPAAPENLYAITKLAAEQAVLRLAGLYAISAAALRLGTVFGPWEWATGVRDTLSPHLQALECLMQGQEAVLSPPHRVDYVDVRDVAEAIVGLLPLQQATGVFNIARGEASSVADFCAALARQESGFRWRLAAAGEAANVVTHAPRDRAPFAVGRIQAATGWQPRFNLDHSAQALLAWRQA